MSAITQELPPIEAPNPEVVELDLANKARHVTTEELVRDPRSSDSESLNPRYVENQTAVRGFIVDSLVDGSLYSDDPEDFIARLAHAHRLAAAGGVYDDVGRGDLKITEDNTGKLRVNTPIVKDERRFAYAKVFADRYGEDFDFNSFNTRQIKLPGMEDNDIAAESFSADGYIFTYPGSIALPKYLGMASQIGVELQQMIQEHADPEEIVRLVAMQYQYLAVARPFAQINNSLAMNLANAQLKLAGLEGMSHRSMDLVAQRLGQETFVRFFSDRVVVNQFSKARTDESVYFDPEWSVGLDERFRRQSVTDTSPLQ